MRVFAPSLRGGGSNDDDDAAAAAAPASGLSDADWGPAAIRLLILQQLYKGIHIYGALCLITTLATTAFLYKTGGIICIVTLQTFMPDSFWIYRVVH